MTIKEMRTATGLSQSGFASYMHVNVDTLRVWEQKPDKTPVHIAWMIHRILELEGKLPKED